MSTYEISKSSLLSLKAEILKKQEEVNKAKYVNNARLARPVKKGFLELKNKGVDGRADQDNFNEEDEDLLKRSKAALEAKSKLYDKLSKGRPDGLTDERNKHYLVRFDKKPSHVPPMEFVDDDEDKYPESEEDNNVNAYEDADNSGDEWVEYEDSFGRTRTCLKKDLAFIKAKDKKIKQDDEPKKNDEFDNKSHENKSYHDDKSRDDEEIETQSQFNDNNEMLSADMRREIQRQKWEDEEAKLSEKTNVHYQDILFSEARNHGVGYYGFSKDEEERAKQQEALLKLRKETQDKQKTAQEIKKNREKQMATRIRAAKNRKRARLGLPPLTSDDEREPEKEAEVVVEKVETAEDKEKDVLRKMHVRPWDIGKEGVKEHYEYTQEEWVLLQREKRDNEFAPPRHYKSTTMRELDSEPDKGLYFSTKKKFDSSKYGAKFKSTDESSAYGETNESQSESNDALFYIDTAGAAPKHINPYKTKEYTQPLETNHTFVPKPIQDECIDFNDEQDRLMQDYEAMNPPTTDEDEEERGYPQSGVEIAPPPTYDYYGPSSSKRSKNKTTVNMEDSIMEGLKFLRQKVEKNNKY